MRRVQREADFSEFYLARRHALRRTAYLIVRDWHSAEDLTQQAMVKLYAVVPRVRRDTADAFARKVVVNECLSHLRRRRDIPVEQLPDRAAQADDQATLEDRKPCRMSAWRNPRPRLPMRRSTANRFHVELALVPRSHRRGCSTP
jgi:DNA-directed RNA polymerase specialized sigma24 family protein